RELGHSLADNRVLLRLNGQERERRRPLRPRPRQIACVGCCVGLGCELFQLVRMNECGAGRAHQSLGRELRAARRTARWRQGVVARGAPTRYGPTTLITGAPVIFHACRIPRKMMNALIRPDGIDPMTTSTGSASRRPEKITTLRTSRGVLGLVGAG